MAKRALVPPISATSAVALTARPLQPLQLDEDASFLPLGLCSPVIWPDRPRFQSGMCGPRKRRGGRNPEIKFCGRRRLRRLPDRPGRCNIRYGSGEDTMAEYRLYCMKESGNAYKAALMLALSGADWEPVWVDYFNGATRTEAFKAEINEMGEVPVLVHGPTRLSQSGVILN